MVLRLRSCYELFESWDTLRAYFKSEVLKMTLTRSEFLLPNNSGISIYCIETYRGWEFTSHLAFQGWIVHWGVGRILIFALPLSLLYGCLVLYH